MFDRLLGRKFYSKCKMLIKLTKTRIEAIRKKRNAVQKFLKSDVADLLRNAFDYNAYGRVEGLLVEQNMSTCYDFVEQFCGCVSNHLSLMQKQRECPEDCREAVSSLMYAAARFADLPELRELRSVFSQRYTNSFEPYISKEFVEKLRSKHPSKDMKLQLLHDIAQDSSIEWDSKALEQKLFTPPAPEQDQIKHGSFHHTDDGDECHKSEDDAALKRGDLNDHTLPKRNESDATDDKFQLHRSSEDEVNAVHRPDNIDKDSQHSVGSVSEDEADNRRPWPSNYRIVPPPYIKPNPGNNESSFGPTNGNVHQDSVGNEVKPKPRSVRRNKLKTPPGWDNVNSSETEGAAKQGSQTRQADYRDQRDEEEKIMDGLLMHYSKKQESELGVGPARAASFPTEPTSPPKSEAKGHARATSMQPEMLARHVHPKLPDYDQLAARFAKGR